MTTANRVRQGFTLMETVIAIGVVAVLLTTFLAVFGPASQSIERALSAKEANRLQSALERELQILREETDDVDEFASPFEKAFDWIKESGNSTKAVLIYNYRGDPTNIRDDGSLAPYEDNEGQPGEDYLLQAGVRRMGDNDTYLQEDLKQVEGRVYLVRMTQLIFGDGTMETGQHGTISDPHEDGESYDDATDYPEGVVAFNAEFYGLRSRDFNYLQNNLDLDDSNGDGKPDRLGTPLFTRPIAIRR